MRPSQTCVMLSKPTMKLFDVRHTFAGFMACHFHPDRPFVLSKIMHFVLLFLASLSFGMTTLVCLPWTSLQTFHLVFYCLWPVLGHEIDPVLGFEKRLGFATDCCAPAMVLLIDTEHGLISWKKNLPPLRSSLRHGFKTMAKEGGARVNIVWKDSAQSLCVWLGAGCGLKFWRGLTVSWKKESFRLH